MLCIAQEPINAVRSGSLGDQLNDPTVAELKLKINKLERELQQARDDRQGTAEHQRIHLLENLLEDANKMKEKIEQELLQTHQKNLALEAELSKWKSGGAPVERWKTITKEFCLPWYVVCLIARKSPSNFVVV